MLIYVYPSLYIPAFISSSVCFPLCISLRMYCSPYISLSIYSQSMYISVCIYPCISSMYISLRVFSYIYICFYKYPLLFCVCLPPFILLRIYHSLCVFFRLYPPLCIPLCICPLPCLSFLICILLYACPPLYMFTSPLHVCVFHICPSPYVSPHLSLFIYSSLFVPLCVYCSLMYVS